MAKRGLLLLESLKTPSLLTSLFSHADYRGEDADYDKHTNGEPLPEINSLDSSSCLSGPIVTITVHTFRELDQCHIVGSVNRDA